MKLFGFRINPQPAIRRFATKAFCALAACCMLAATCSFAFPATAFADYSNPSINTIAQMRTDGSLHVVEQRSYNFSEDYDAITWQFTGLASKQEAEVASVRMIRMDSEGNILRDWTNLPEVPFQQSWRDFVWDTEGLTSKVQSAEEAAKLDPNNSSANIALPDGDSYSYDKRYSVLYVFLGDTDETTVIECDYAITNAALVYDDTAEIYWDYISARQDVLTSNVHARIQLPVPEGAVVVPGENVRAWGHGPEGTVEVRADGTIDLYVPLVRLGQYAQAHVLFPRSWLTNVTLQSKLVKSGTRYDDAVYEEAYWVDSYNAGLVNGMTLDVVVLVICIVALIGAVAAWVAFGRERTPEGGFDGEAAENAAISACEPSVIGRLLRWNQRSSADFVSTLKSLVSRGVIQLVEPETAYSNSWPSPEQRMQPWRRGTSSDVAEMRLRLSPTAKTANLSALDRGAMNIVFDLVGDGYQSVSLAEVASFRDSHPEKLREAMGKWQDELGRMVDSAGLFDKRSYKAAAWVAGLAAIFLVWGLARLFTTWDWLISLILIATGILLAMIAYNMPRRTERGVELEAQALAGTQAQAAAQPHADATAQPQAGAQAPSGDNEDMKEAAWRLLEKETSF